MDTHLLEVNLISAQGLKSPPSAKLRRLTTYAVAWVLPSAKLRTRINRVGAENPTWNDKFIFRVTSDFLRGETSAVSVEIYAVGVLKDTLIGSVRFLISSFVPPSAGFPLVHDDDAYALSESDELQIPGIGFPVFNAFQIRRPSGRFHGVLNVGGMLIVKSSGFAGFGEVPAIGYRDLMGKGFDRRNVNHYHNRASSQVSEELDSCGKYSFRAELSSDFSDDGSESTESASSASSSRCSTPSMVLGDLNGRDLMAGNGCGMMLCRPRIGVQKKVDNHHHISAAADENSWGRRR